MNDDFRLFAPPSDGGDAIDADIALITAYLARALSTVQIVAVEERLSTDVAFRSLARPIVDAWMIPGRLTTEPAQRGPSVMILAAEARDAGWARYLASQQTAMIASGSIGQPLPASAQNRLRPTDWRRIAQIAAVIAAVLVPILGVAQVARHFFERGAGSGSGGSVAPSNPAATVGAAGQHAPPAMSEPGREGRALVPVPRALAQDSTRILRLVREIAIGDSATPLRSSGIRIGPRGEMLVGEAGQKRFLIFDSTGRRLRAIEDVTAGATAFGWIGDSVWVSASERTRLFRPDGRQIADIDLDRARPSRADAARIPVLHFRSAIGMYADHSMLVDAGPDARDPLVLNRSFKGSRFVVVDRNGLIRRIIGDVPPGGGISYQVPGQFIWCGAPVPFAESDRWAVSPDGTRIATTTTVIPDSRGGTVRLRVLNVSGDTVVKRDINFAGIPISLTDAQRALEGVYADIASRTSPCGPEQLVDYKARAPKLVPLAHPPVNGVFIGHDGVLLLDVVMLGGSTTLMFDRAGQPLGRLRLPPGGNIVAAERGRVWIAERMAGVSLPPGSGIPSAWTVVRYRIE